MIACAPLARSPRSSGFVARRILPIIVVVGAGIAGEGVAADRVTLQLPQSKGKVILSGVIVDSTGRLLLLRPDPQSPIRSYPASQVAGIETALTAVHERGLQRYAAKDPAAAQIEFRQALKEEQRAWVRREILASLIRCALWQGQHHVASEYFLQLVASDPDTPHFRLIPLVWGPQEVIASARAQAEPWLSEESAVARLLAASILLEDATLGKPAEIVLRELASNADSRIKDLAQAQVWRLSLRGKVPDRDSVHRWRQRVDELPASLRSGPSFLVGRAYALRREYEPAALAYLWTPLMDDQNPQLAARGLLEAGFSLRALGQPEPAALLWHEATTRFPGTPAAGAIPE